MAGENKQIIFNELHIMNLSGCPVKTKECLNFIQELRWYHG